MTCSSLIDFADGNLVGAQRKAFERHLKVCDACESALVRHVQIDARLRELGEQVRAQTTRTPRAATVIDPPRLTRWQRFRRWMWPWGPA